MGCDIHMHVEYKRTINNIKKWICGDYFKVNPYYNSKCVYEEPFELVDFCDDRNYNLFAILANVRNYGETDYISNPRGLPDDVTKEVQAEAERWGEDGHSHSYITLKELLDFQENIKPLKQQGMVSPKEQKALDEKGTLPSMWCQGTNMEGWAWRKWEMENTVLLPLIESLKRRADELGVIYDIQWERDYEEAYKRSEDIRIVFWFDN